MVFRMDFRFLRIVTITLTLALSTVADDVVCPDNEQPGCESPCAPTCQDNTPKDICTLQCIGPCICKKGYIREGPHGMCVPKTCEGVSICKVHEKFVNCPTPCPVICNQTIPTICPKICLRVGCVCEDGYVREFRDGRCVPEDKCTFQCREPNQVFNDCKTNACPGSCSEPARVCKRCIKECVCKEGYLLNDRTGRCVKKEQCSKVCRNTNE